MATSFDIDAYRNELRQKLDGPVPSLGGPPAISIDQSAHGYPAPRQGQSAGEGPLMTPVAEGTNNFHDTGGAVGDEGEQTGEPADPQQPAMKTNQLGDSKGLDSAPGAPKLSFTPKVEKAKTVGEVIDAAKPKSLNNYMDWWEAQHGAIDDKWNHVQEQIGAKPDPNRLMSRKEKFAALMDFGINLIKASQGRGEDTVGTFATAVGATAEGETMKRKQEEHDWEGKNAAVQKGRLEEQKSIGNYGDALKGQASIDMNRGRQTAEEAKLAREQGAAPDTLSTDQGVHQWNPITKKFEPTLGVDGKPLTNLKVGGRGGQHDSRTAKEKDYEFLVAHGKDPASAELIAFAERTGDPRKDYLTVFNRALTTSFGDEKKAKQIAEEAIKYAYPDGTDIQDDSPPMRPRAPSVQPPPVNLLKPGQVTKFKNGQKWTLDASGQPKQVK